MTNIQKELLDAIEEIALETNMTIEEVTKQAIELLEIEIAERRKNYILNLYRRKRNVNMGND